MSRSHANRLATIVLSALVTAGAALGCSAPSEPVATTQPAPAPPPPAVEPAVSINAVMVALVDHAAHQLWNVEQAAPKDDAGWREVEHHAIQLAGIGPSLAAGGTGERDKSWSTTPTWAAHVRNQTAAAAAAIDAARAKSTDALFAANSQLVQACEACHKEFKPDLPTEGIAHPH